jgi:hypothetical protein
MAHFVQITDGVITKGLVIHNDVVGTEFPASEPIGKQFIAEHGYEGEWVQTSFNNNFRKQYGLMGGTYNAEHDVFIAPQPFLSWSLDANHDWQAPTPKPEGYFYWDEDVLEWVAFPTI